CRALISPSSGSSEPSGGTRMSASERRNLSSPRAPRVLRFFRISSRVVVPMARPAHVLPSNDASGAAFSTESAQAGRVKTGKVATAIQSAPLNSRHLRSVKADIPFVLPAHCTRSGDHCSGKRVSDDVIALGVADSAASAGADEDVLLAVWELV